ncbi:MAG: FAD-dependent oxidoreductase [Anaerolineae bacterium]|nr:MAG: FAD-dependent oxidoreductase [Anaerolineae bacterium]WKZ43391.1 MAG: FAD-dependent oxidoreductase [Anaerolineales bacterium]
MDSKPDILIIGGGVIGVCSAYYLVQKGVQVTLIEKDEIASGCSYGNGGLIVPSHSVPLASPSALGSGLRWLFDLESPFYIKPRMDLELLRWLIRFVLDSREKQMLKSLPILRDLLLASRALYEDLAKNAGFDFGFEGKGSLLVCLSERALEKERREIHLFERFKIPVSAVNREEALEIEPALSPNIAGGVYYPRDGRIDPRRFVVGLAEKAKKLGAQFHTETEAMGVESENGRVAIVHTTRGEFHPKQVILASGSWSPGVARALSLRIPIQPAKGYSVTLENPPVTPRLPLLFSEARTVINPLGHALRVAGTLELAGMDFSFNPKRIRAMQKASAEYLPGLSEARVIEIWRGLRPCTPDGLPILSRVKEFANLIVAAGHAMLGMSLGPVTGKLVAQLALAEQTDLNLAPLAANRF